MSVEFQIVVPCYNEAKNLPLLLDRFVDACRRNNFNATRAQLILVNNGSVDESAGVLKELQASNCGDFFKLVTVVKNQGYGFGLRAGLETSTAPWVGWTHADLQCDLHDLFRAYDVLLNSPQPPQTFVKGRRRGRSLKEKVISRGYEFLASLFLGFLFFEINAQPKLFHRQLLAVLPQAPQHFGFDLYFLHAASVRNLSIVDIPVEFPARIHGFSSWAFSLKSRSRTMLQLFRYIFELRRKKL